MDVEVDRPEGQTLKLDPPNVWLVVDVLGRKFNASLMKGLEAELAQAPIRVLESAAIVLLRSGSRRRAIDDRQLRLDHRGVERRSIVEIEQILEGARILIAQRQVKTPGAPARLIV